MCPNFSECSSIAGQVGGDAGDPSSRRCPFPPLRLETRELVPTDCAAFHLNRAAQTLREWASTERGLLRPVRVGKRLGWRVDDLRRLLSGERS